LATGRSSHHQHAVGAESAVLARRLGRGSGTSEKRIVVAKVMIGKITKTKKRGKIERRRKTKIGEARRTRAAGATTP